MNNQSVELTGFLIIAITILLYLIGWYLHFDEPWLYNAVFVPVVIIALSFTGLFLAASDADGRPLLKFLLWGTIICMAIYFVGLAFLSQFSGMGRTT